MFFVVAKATVISVFLLLFCSQNRYNGMAAAK